MEELIMVQICFILAILCEMGMGILIINKIYPEFRFQNKIMKVLAVFLLGLAAYIYIYGIHGCFTCRPRS